MLNVIDYVKVCKIIKIGQKYIIVHSKTSMKIWKSKYKNIIS